MKAIITASLLAVPAAAQAMCMHGPMGGCGTGSCGGGLFAGAAYAVVAVLGYWVMLQAVKESSACVKRIGDVLGGILVIVGLLGLLCSAANHCKSSMKPSCAGSMPGMEEMPPGHPQVPGMTPPPAAPEKKGGKAK